MRIDLSELKETIDRTFDHIINTRGIKTYELDKDLYWYIPSPDVYDPRQEPHGENMTLGSFSDNWEFLRKVLEPDDGPLAWHLTQLAPLLRYLGERLGEDLAKDDG